MHKMKINGKKQNIKEKYNFLDESRNILINQYCNLNISFMHTSNN